MILFFLIFLGFWWARHAYSFGMMSRINIASVFLVSFSLSLFCLYNILCVISFYMLQRCNVTVTKPGFRVGYRYIQMSCSEGLPWWVLLGGEPSSLLFSGSHSKTCTKQAAEQSARSRAQQLGLWGAKPYLCGKRGGSGNQSLTAGMKLLKNKFWNLAMQILMQSLLEICLSWSL